MLPLCGRPWWAVCWGDVLFYTKFSRLASPKASIIFKSSPGDMFIDFRKRGRGREGVEEGKKEGGGGRERLVSFLTYAP